MMLPRRALGASPCWLPWEQSTFLMLASAGGTSRSGRPPLLDVLLAAAVLAGTATSLNYLWNMVRRQERACPYCLLGAATHFAMLPLVLPRARAALRQRKSTKRPLVE